jgi:two-component system response regulator AtoC
MENNILVIRRALCGHSDSGTCEATTKTADADCATPAGDALFVDSAWGKKMHSVLKQVAVSDVPVLFLGETGVGKEVFARYVHAQSPRAHRAFVKVNCAALPSDLIESELFGFDRGAFTGAHASKPGLFEVANGGTIFLDEIGDMSLSLQAKLLQVLQDHSFQRLGGRTSVRVDVRVMAATHHDLERESRQGRFRDDLYYRLNVITIHVPALRDRREEILPLADFLLRKHAAPGAPAPELSAPLTQELLTYAWPGNIRELENAMRNLLVFRDQDVLEEEIRRRKTSICLHGETVGTGELCPSRPDAVAPAPGSSLLRKIYSARDEAEANAVTSALNRGRWNRRVAADILGISYKALLYRMKKLGITSRSRYDVAEDTAAVTSISPGSDKFPQNEQPPIQHRSRQRA